MARKPCKKIHAAKRQTAKRDSQCVPDKRTPGQTVERGADKTDCDKQFTILFGAARLDDHIKVLPILIEATKILKSEYPRESDRIKLVTFGNLKYPDSLEGIAINSQHLGRINGEDAIREVYLSADAVVSTSLYETLPGTLIEGQFYGCIPVAFNRGDLPDIIDHKETGYMADWHDDNQKAAKNIAEGIIWAYRQKREEIVTRMYEMAKSRFAESAIAAKYIELFESLT